MILIIEETSNVCFKVNNYLMVLKVFKTFNKRQTYQPDNSS